MVGRVRVRVELCCPHACCSNGLSPKYLATKLMQDHYALLSFTLFDARGWVYSPKTEDRNFTNFYTPRVNLLSSSYEIFRVYTDP